MNWGSATARNRDALLPDPVGHPEDLGPLGRILAMHRQLEPARQTHRSPAQPHLNGHAAKTAWAVPKLSVELRRVDHATPTDSPGGPPNIMTWSFHRFSRCAVFTEPVTFGNGRPFRAALG